MISIFGVGINVGYGFQIFGFVRVVYLNRYFMFVLVWYISIFGVCAGVGYAFRFLALVLVSYIDIDAFFLVLVSDMYFNI